MLSEKMATHLNKQIQAEMYSSYLYLGLCFELQHNGFTGFAHWMKCQSDEEWHHALKITEYMKSRGCIIELNKIEPAKIEWGCPCDAMRKSLEHEKLITKSILNIMNVAEEEKDYATQDLMQWFVNEQVEEKHTLNMIIRRLETLGDDASGIIFMDKELGKRKENPCR